MKKIIVTLAASLVLTIGASNVLSTKLSTKQKTPIASNSSISESKSLEQSTDITGDAIQPQIEHSKKVEDTKQADAKTSSPSSTPKKNTKSTQSPSRGGLSISSQKNLHNSNTSNNANASKYGELLDWKQVQSIIPISTNVRVTDLGTGKYFNIKRTFGTNHIDGEALTISDTNIIKSIWGGFSWVRRPVIININGRKIAASMTAMPHAGVDSAPAVTTVSNRSGGYGTGENLDAVKNNGMSGVIDIHFLNSTRHKDNRQDPQHQAAILKAAGK
ncbi:hypothetical protein GCM10008905_31170 [Clostridium malenominatum]|uniref:Uncharacterized protein n=1 Tax=Clostridium malenominatum TaxID=1539 RepID=A0ABP3UCL1_9CLOT